MHTLHNRLNDLLETAKFFKIFIQYYLQLSLLLDLLHFASQFFCPLVTFSIGAFESLNVPSSEFEALIFSSLFQNITEMLKGYLSIEQCLDKRVLLLIFFGLMNHFFNLCLTQRSGFDCDVSLLTCFHIFSWDFQDSISGNVKDNIESHFTLRSSDHSINNEFS